MAALNRVDPNDIHAVVVGLEHYPHAPRGWSLRGAGEDALRFARWLQQGGVPPQNIRFLLSPLEESQASLAAAATEAGLGYRTVASAGEIRDVFIRELKDTTGELLYVYWGGHGVLGEDSRLLFYPDASAEDKLCLRVEELRVFLTQMASRGFSQQVLFFDACATFVEEHGAESAPVVMPFPNPDRETVHSSCCTLPSTDRPPNRMTRPEAARPPRCCSSGWNSVLPTCTRTCPRSTTTSESTSKRNARPEDPSRPRSPVATARSTAHRTTPKPMRRRSTTPPGSKSAASSKARCPTREDARCMPRRWPGRAGRPGSPPATPPRSSHRCCSTLRERWPPSSICCRQTANPIRRSPSSLWLSAILRRGCCR